jgi:hypothetical protein
MPPEKRMFGYLLQLYEAMERESDKKIYEGKVVTTFQNLGISMAHYTPLFNALKELGCIELIDRGVRGRPTKYRLHHKPSEDAYENLYAGVANGLTSGGKAATIGLDEIEQRVKNIEGRLKGLDINTINEAIANHEARLSKLEVPRRTKKGGSTT